MTDGTRILIVDDDLDILDALAQNLGLVGYDVEAHTSARTALTGISRDFAGIVLSDLRMPEIDGLELLRRCCEIDRELPVILISAHADVDIAMQAMRQGAYDFVTKPFDAQLLQAALRRAAEWRRVVLANRTLHSARERTAAAAVVGESVAMQRVFDEVRAIAATDLPCLIEGEPGSGASTIAQLLHRLSRRSSGPLVAVDCLGAALPGAESQLFGHASGAFPGATMPRTGEIERANRGILVLDHVEGLPKAHHSRIERLIDERTLQPLGSDATRSLDIRCVATMRRKEANTAAVAINGSSMFYKLRASQITLPPLRHRREDIEPLFRRFFAAAVAASPGSTPPKLGASIWSFLARHDWPGNLVELETYARSAADGVAESGSVIAPATSAPTAEQTLRARMAQHEAAILRQTLHEVGGDIRTAIERLGLPRKTFYERLARHGIVAADYRP